MQLMGKHITATKVLAYAQGVEARLFRATRQLFINQFSRFVPRVIVVFWLGLAACAAGRLPPLTPQRVGGSFVQQWRGRTPTPTAVVFLPGFPAETNKNEKLAELLATQGLDAFVIHYDGLGQSEGEFSFQRSIARSRELIETQIAPRYERVHVVGHSWGAVVAVSVKHQLGAKIDRLVLLAPLTRIPTSEEARPFLGWVKSQFPRLATLELDARVADLVAIDQPARLAAAIEGSQVLVVQGGADTNVEPAGAKALAEAFKGRAKLLWLPDADHEVGVREDVAAATLQWLASP